MAYNFCISSEIEITLMILCVCLWLSNTRNLHQASSQDEIQWRVHAIKNEGHFCKLVLTCQSQWYYYSNNRTGREILLALSCICEDTECGWDLVNSHELLQRNDGLMIQSRLFYLELTFSFLRHMALASNLSMVGRRRCSETGGDTSA